MNDKQEIKNAPVTVTVASDTEPVKCDGTYSEYGNGFELAFAIGGDSFTVKHDISCTRLKATGVMSYDIELKNDITDTLLATPYGAVRFKVKTIERSVVRENTKLNIALKYLLTSDAGDELARAVELSAEIK